MKIGVFGAGAFGTALALSWSRRHDVVLWGRGLSDGASVSPRLPDHPLGPIHATSQIDRARDTDVWVLAPSLKGLLPVLDMAQPRTQPIVLCCKGFDPDHLLGPVTLARAKVPTTPLALLTGPSFATDIAAGKPTALTLACADAAKGTELRNALSTPTLRLYHTSDVAGAELGGALKNVMAIAAGATMGAGLGPSARAALITRGFAEMQRLAATLGARDDTLHGLSGLGDLMLTATSRESRNLRYGEALGAGADWDPAITVEGRTTALAMERLAHQRGLELPITCTVARLIRGEIDVATALTDLMTRPLKEE